MYASIHINGFFNSIPYLHPDYGIYIDQQKHHFKSNRTGNVYTGLSYWAVLQRKMYPLDMPLLQWCSSSPELCRPNSIHLAFLDCVYKLQLAQISNGYAGRAPVWREAFQTKIDTLIQQEFTSKKRLWKMVSVGMVLTNGDFVLAGRYLSKPAPISEQKLCGPSGLSSSVVSLGRHVPADFCDQTGGVTSHGQ